MWEVHITARTVLCRKLDRWNFCVNTSYLSVELSIIEYRKAVTHWPMHFICVQSYVYPVSSPTPWAECSIMLTEMSSKSPCSIKWWSRCLCLNVAKGLQSQRMCEAVSDVCLHLLHSGLVTSPSFNRCPFKWQCPVSIRVNIHNLFLLRLSNSPALFAKGFFFF
jgi:hypothetical protein